MRSARSATTARAAVASFAGLFWLALSGAAWGHGGEYILARCHTDSAGRVTLDLAVDCAQHPVLKDRAAAEAAMREVLRLETPSGPQLLDLVSAGVPALSSHAGEWLPPVHAPTDNLTAPHTLTRISYSWVPDVAEVRFSIPQGNPHDVLFWLAGEAHPLAEPAPAPWRILIAGDSTPPILVPAAVGMLEKAPPAASPPSQSTPPILIALLTLLVFGAGFCGMQAWRKARERAAQGKS